MYLFMDQNTENGIMILTDKFMYILLGHIIIIYIDIICFCLHNHKYIVHPTNTDLQNGPSILCH